ncbi:MAG: ATP-binding protein [Oscillospiraceae bacterium]
MFRSLHMKLVLIMVLLIVSLMTVVGAFLTNSVSRFYMDDFYRQMETVFSDREFARDLTTPEDGEEDGAAALQRVLQQYMGALGVDSRNRNYYILDGQTGEFLTGSDPETGTTLKATHNLTAALNGEEGSDGDPTASFMDVAIPITRGETDYVIYVLDNRATVESLSSELFNLILEALVFGLIISVLLSFLLAKTMITPIERLTDAAERVANGDFSRRIEVSSRDEIGILTSAFNDMARQLKDTLDAVENERNKLSTLFLHMTDGVAAFARDGQLIHSNPAAERMLQTRLDADTRYDPLFGDIAPLFEVMSAPAGGYIEGEREVRGRTLALLLAPFSSESQGGVLVVIRDVTEQHKVEEQRKEFVANVSHELRTPLTNIRSYAETLADSAGELPAEMERNFLGVILNESDRMTHIVQDLLTLSRFDSGRSELKLSNFPFGGAVRDVYNAVVLEAQRHQHELVLDLPEDLPEIRADRERVLQVMMNVVSNAIKYTPDGGRIAISAGRAGKRVWMEVADNGIGIPAEDRARVFERFYRVDKARSRQSGGTGLGLSIAKEIMDQHKGYLGLVDREGPGTTIRMELNVEGPDHEE